jgi:hypothetical protein
MKVKHKPSASPQELGNKARRLRRNEVPRRLWRWLVALLAVIILVVSECLIVLPVE